MATLETETATITVDPQDALPESNWGPRRWFTFLSQAFAFLLIAAAIVTKAQASVSAWLVAFCIANSIFYLVAPSAEQVAKMFASLSALKAGIGFRSSTSVDSAAGTVETATESTPAISPDAKPGD